MTEDDWKTLRVPPEAYDEAKAQKEEHDRTWGEQLVCDNTTTTEVVETSDVVEDLLQEIDAAAFNGQLSDEQANRIVNSLKALEERTNKIERQLEELR